MSHPISHAAQQCLLYRGLWPHAHHNQARLDALRVRHHHVADGPRSLRTAKDVDAVLYASLGQPGLEALEDCSKKCVS